MNLLNMSREHLVMLDKMWNIQSATDLDMWMKSLSDRELKMAESLRLMLIYEMIDESTSHLTHEDFTEVQELLKNL